MTDLPLIVVIGAFFAAIISGLTGLAGGTLLMSVLAVSLPPIEAIAVHSGIQVFSNLSRVLVFFRSIRWSAFFLFSILAPVGVYLGARCLGAVPEHWVQVTLGVVIIYSALSLSRRDQRDLWPQWVFVILGAVSGFVSTFAGVVGPVIAPYFIRAGLTKESLIATKAICQLEIQLLKVLLIAKLLGVSVDPMNQNFLIAVLVTVVGTLTAKKILRHLKAKYFELAVQMLLVLIGAKILFSGLGWM